MDAPSNDLQNMESIDFNLKLDKGCLYKPYEVNVTYAGRQVVWKFYLLRTLFNIQFDLKLHEDLVFTSDKPLKVKAFNISSRRIPSMEFTQIKYTYSSGVFHFDPLRSTGCRRIEDNHYDVNFSFLLDKAGFVSARNSIVTTFPDYTYIIKWNLDQKALHQNCFIVESPYIAFTYRLKPIRWQLRLCSYMMCSQKMVKLTLQTPDNISFNREDPILKSNLQFLRGNQCVMIATNDSYSWDGNTCSFVTPYDTCPLLTSGKGTLKVQFEFTVDNADSQSDELPSRSTELATTSTADTAKMDTALADLRKKAALVSEYNYVLKWGSLAIPKESPPIEVTYRRSHIIWNMQLNCSKVDKNHVKFALHTSSKIKFHQKNPVLYSSLIIMRDGYLMVSKSNDLYTWKDGTFEFETIYDTSDWRQSGDYKIRFEFTLKNSKQHNFESNCFSVPASSSCSNDSFEIINDEQCSDDGLIEAIHTDIETAVLVTKEMSQNSSSCTSLDDVSDIRITDEVKCIEKCSDDQLNMPIESNAADEEATPISPITKKRQPNSASCTSLDQILLMDMCVHPVKSIEQCSDDDSATSIHESAGDLEAEPEAMDCLIAINDEQPVAVNAHKDMTLAADFQRLFDTSSNYDAVINTDFKVHRSILAIRSPEFDRIIREAQENENGLLQLSIRGISNEDMRALLKYIYTGTMATVRSFQTLFVVAERFGVIGLKMLCEDKICSGICATTYLDNMHLINECKSEKVHERFLTFMQKDISSLVNSVKFKQFMTNNPEIMFQLLSRVVEPNLQQL